MIYVLVRSSKEVSSEDRLADLLESPAFQRIRGRQECSVNALSYCLRAVDGDLERDHLGLPTYDELSGTVDVVLHCAALVDWAAPLHRSLQTNAIGSKRVAEFAKAADARLVCVSTAWVHGMVAGKCPEVMLKRSIDPEAELARCFSQLEEFQQTSVQKKSMFLQEASHRLGPGSDLKSLETLAEEMRKKWIDAQMAEWGVAHARECGWWDGYTFSKAIAEMLVQDIQDRTPFAIVRPSGVVSAASEPLPGWVDAYLLVEPLIEGVGRGEITQFPGRSGCVIDCVPVDYVCNVIIAAATMHGSDHGDGSPLVYQCASGDVCPNTLGEIESTWRQYFQSQPMHRDGKAVQVDPVRFVPSAEDFVRSLRLRYITPLWTCSQAVQLLPGWQHSNLLRSARSWLERKRRGVEKVTLLARLYSTYTLNEWSFETSRTRELMAAVAVPGSVPSNQGLPRPERFPYFAQGRPWDWTEFWTQKHIPGMRRWVLKESIPSRL